MEQYGNTSTYNMESVLRKNIVDSEYYRDTCMKLTTWGQVVDEIFYSVTDVEPWMSGNARGASTAFCLLHRCVLTATGTTFSKAQPTTVSVLTSSMLLQALHPGAHPAGSKGSPGSCRLCIHPSGEHKSILLFRNAIDSLENSLFNEQRCLNTSLHM